MATYKISYLFDNSYSSKGEVYISNVSDEYDAVDIASYKYDLNDAKITNVELICE